MSLCLRGDPGRGVRSTQVASSLCREETDSLRPSWAGRLTDASTALQLQLGCLAGAESPSQVWSPAFLPEMHSLSSSLRAPSHSGIPWLRQEGHIPSVSKQEAAELTSSLAGVWLCTLRTRLTGRPCGSEMGCRSQGDASSLAHDSR